MKTSNTRLPGPPLAGGGAAKPAFREVDRCRVSARRDREEVLEVANPLGREHFRVWARAENRRYITAVHAADEVVVGSPECAQAVNDGVVPGRNAPIPSYCPKPDIGAHLAREDGCQSAISCAVGPISRRASVRRRLPEFAAGPGTETHLRC